MELFIHYKGGRYLQVGIAQTHEHNGDLDVVYISLKHGTMVTRPFRRDSRGQDSWIDLIEWPDHVARHRFTAAERLTPNELQACFGEKS